MDPNISDEEGGIPYWTFSDQHNSEKSCGCVSEPPSFDLPPPPIPPAIFTQFDSDSNNVDWISLGNSDSSLDTCREEIDRWTDFAVNTDTSPKWPGTDKEENEIGNGDVTTTQTPRFWDIFEQPLTGIVIIAAACCVLVLSICLLAFYCRRKSIRRGCSILGVHENKTNRMYQNGYPPLAAHRLRRSKKGKHVRVLEGSSPATTTTTMAPLTSRHYGGFGTTMSYDSGEDTHDERENFLAGDVDLCQATPTGWSYDPMNTGKGRGWRNGRNEATTRTVVNGKNVVKYGAIPTTPPSFQPYPRNQPVVLIKMDNGRMVTTASPSIPPPSHLDAAQSMYDSHNPIYEEISLHEKSLDSLPRHRRLSEQVTNYVDSGASSGNSDPNLHHQDVDYCQVDGHSAEKSTLTVDNSPCCSSGRSECDECCIEERPSSAGLHNKEACPFSPRSRKRQEISPSHSTSAVGNKVNRSTQSGESCLEKDEFYPNACCECSGRESGYGTDSRCPSSTRNRIRNRYRYDNQSNDKNRTVDSATMRGQYESSPKITTGHSPKFYTLRHDGKTVGNGPSSFDGLKGHLVKTDPSACVVQNGGIRRPTQTVSCNEMQKSPLI